MRFLRRLLKGLLPPLGKDLLFRLKDRMGLYEWKFVAYTWPEYTDKIKGWNLDQIAELQHQKWPAYLDLVQSKTTLGINHEAELPYETQDLVFHNILYSFGYVLALSAQHKKQVKMLDWGGGIGHYGVLSDSLLPADTSLDYSCYDLPPYIKIALEHWSKLPIKSRFSAERKDFLENQSYDLVLASSSLWYETDWKSMLRALAAVADNYLYITRMIFVKNSDSYVALQRPAAMGYKTSYHFWVLNETELKEFAVSLGFEWIREFVFSEKMVIYQAPENGKIKGFLFQKIKTYA